MWNFKWQIKLRVIITDVFKTIVNKLFLKSFDTSFMGNIKNHQKKVTIFFFLFSYKKFLKLFLKPISLRRLLTFLQN